MANEEHLAILRQGVETWNQWRKKNPDIVPDLRGADLIHRGLYGVGFGLYGVDLSGADLREAHLGGAYLGRATLSGADLRGADLRAADFRAADFRAADLGEADLRGARLGVADLREADLTVASLSEADLNRANLSGADLSRADLSGADVEGAVVAWSVFGGVDLSEVKGLDKVVHNGPSTVGIDTIYRSKGKIPGAFLRGCGVPDAMIAYIGSLVGKPIEYYSCFISYSAKTRSAPNDYTPTCKPTACGVGLRRKI